MVELSKYPASWKIILERMIGNVIIAEVDALICFALSKAENHAPYGQLVGTTECTL
jgi:hypothetical protein